MRDLATAYLGFTGLVSPTRAMRRLFERLLRRANQYRSRVALIHRARKVLGSEIPVDFTLRNGVFVFHNPGNSLIDRGKRFEPEVQHALATLIFLDKLRGNQTVFCDVGANIGLHTVFLREAFPGMEIVAFDPSPFSWRYLQLTIELNSISGVNLYPTALGDSEGEIDLYAWGPSSSGDSLRDTGRQPGKKYNKVTVPIKRLDSFSEIPPLTVMKMDCEGAELEILKGARDRLKLHRPLILSELNFRNQKAFGFSTEDVFREICSTDYLIFDLYFRQLDFDAFSTAHLGGEENYILIPKEFSGV